MTNVPYYIETSQLMWITNQLIGFYMMENIAFNKLNIGPAVPF